MNDDDDDDDGDDDGDDGEGGTTLFEVGDVMMMLSRRNGAIKVSDISALFWVPNPLNSTSDKMILHNAFLGTNGQFANRVLIVNVDWIGEWSLRFDY